MNKTVVLTILFILTLILAIVTVSTEYKFDNERYVSNSVSPYKSNFNTIRDLGEISVAPLRKFCAEKSMEMWTGRTHADTGCKDSSGNTYHYDVTFNNNIWTIGNKTYEAAWR